MMGRRTALYQAATGRDLQQQQQQPVVVVCVCASAASSGPLVLQDVSGRPLRPRSCLGLDKLKKSILSEAWLEKKKPNHQDMTSSAAQASS